MKITVWSIAQYKEVRIETDRGRSLGPASCARLPVPTGGALGLTWNSGALDKDECLALAKELIKAATELMPDKESGLIKDLLATISERI